MLRVLWVALRLSVRRPSAGHSVAFVPAIPREARPRLPGGTRRRTRGGPTCAQRLMPRRHWSSSRGR
eukprot:3983950-Alexandrium_andersonii.AAC.1